MSSVSHVSLHQESQNGLDQNTTSIHTPLLQPKQSFLSDFFKPLQNGGGSDFISPVDVSSYFKYDFIAGLDDENTKESRDSWMVDAHEVQEPLRATQQFVSLAIESWCFFFSFSKIINVFPCSLRDFLDAISLSNPLDNKISPILPEFHITLLRAIKKQLLSSENRQKFNRFVSQICNTSFAIPEEKLSTFRNYYSELQTSSDEIAILTEDHDSEDDPPVNSGSEDFDSPLPRSSTKKSKKRKSLLESTTTITESNWTLALLDCASHLNSINNQTIPNYPDNIDISDHVEFYFNIPLEMRILLLKTLIDIVLMNVQDFHDFVDDNMNILLDEQLDRASVSQDLEAVKEKNSSAKSSYEMVIQELEALKANPPASRSASPAPMVAISSIIDQDPRRVSQRKVEQRHAEKIKVQREHKNTLRSLNKRKQALLSEMRALSRNESMLAKKLDRLDDQYEFAKRVRPSPVAFDKNYRCDYWWLDNKRGASLDSKGDLALLPYCGRLLVNGPNTHDWAYINHPEEAKIALFSTSTTAQKYISGICPTLEQHPDRQKVMQRTLPKEKKPDLRKKRKTRIDDDEEEEEQEENVEEAEKTDLPSWMKYVNLFKSKND